MYRLLTLLFLTTSAWATDPVFTIGSDPIIDITGTGQGLSLGDDQMSGMKNIGFDFTFYDQTFFSSKYIYERILYLPVKL